MAASTGAALAIAGAASAVPIASDFELGPTTPGKWGPAAMGTGASVTYSFMGSGLETDAGAGTSVALSSFMPAGFEAAIDSAFDAWEAVADITFTKVADPGVGWTDAGAGASDIRITGHAFDGPSGTLAHAFFPPSNGGFAAGDMHFDTAETWKIGFGGPGFDVFQVAAHEIGHAIGLAHEEDVTALMNPFYTEDFKGLLADDIAGAKFIYGEKPMAAIPLPASLPLLGGALALMGGFGLRRGRRAA